MDSFDSDVLIYAAVPGHILGRRVAALFPDGQSTDAAPSVGAGSVLLLPELLTKPVRQGWDQEVAALAAYLSRIDLLPVDRLVADLAVALGMKYGLRAADAVHLATAVSIDADRFVTNNQRDFPDTIREIDIMYPVNLPEPAQA